MKKDKKRHNGHNRDSRTEKSTMEENTKPNIEQEAKAPEEVIVDDVNSTPAEEEVADSVVAEGADELLKENEKLKAIWRRRRRNISS